MVTLYCQPLIPFVSPLVAKEGQESVHEPVLILTPHMPKAKLSIIKNVRSQNNDSIQSIVGIIVTGILYVCQSERATECLILS